MYFTGYLLLIAGLKIIFLPETGIMEVKTRLKTA